MVVLKTLNLLTYLRKKNLKEKIRCKILIVYRAVKYKKKKIRKKFKRRNKNQSGTKFE